MPRASAAAAAGHRAGSPLRWRTRDSDRRNGCPIAPTIWPEPSGTADGTELVDRWEALFGRAPRLRPWVDQMLGRHRLRLTESGAAPVEVERTLWLELSRWLVDFEALPGFAVSAIAVTLEDEAAHEVDPGSPDDDQLAPSLTPEQVVSDCEALLSDAAFALAWHCVDA